jgi:DNA-binding MarR family transcriptional regulator
MTSLPSGEVRQYDVLEWAQEQAKYLTPTQHHVLLYLCINAWHTPDNNENAPAGMVLSGRTAMSKIQMRTGLSERTVRDALNALQDNGYILRKSKPGNGQSVIGVLWQEDHDDIRAEIWAGVRDLPKEWKRDVRPPAKRIVGGSEGNIVEFRSGSSRRNNRQDMP